MKHLLLACTLILSLSLNSYSQVSADPALSPIFFTTLSNSPLAANALPLGSGFKINLPFSNVTPPLTPPVAALPAGSCKIKIGLGSKMGMNPGFNIATAAYSQYFSWTVAFAGGQWQITGDLIADLPSGFSGTAVFEVTGTLVGNSTATANFLVTNHNTTTTLSDIDGSNNNATAAYTIVSLLSISINQGASITVCQNAALTLATTTVGTGPFTYSWNNGLGTASSATTPTTAVGTTSYTVTVTDAATNTATATISVTVSGPSTITASAGANGSISSTGATSVNCGMNKTYTITPNVCYRVLDVLVDGVSVGAVTSYTFNNVTANHTIAATFAINTYTITVSAGANGTITPGTGTVNCGSNNVYTITANSCYHIVDVTLDGVSQGAISTLNVNNVTANHTITATFAINNYTITVTPGTNGTITPGSGTVNCGSNNAYTITANACYHIVDVTLDGISQGAVSTVNVNNVTANHTITATFAINTYTITVTAGANGTITPTSGTVNCGSNNTYAITANACYHIVDVTLDGVSQGAVSTLNVNNVTANHTITASFALNTYTITVTPEANGTITPGTGTVNCGSNNTYAITANACYHIVDVTLDGVSQGAISTLNVNNVTADHTITASFAINTYTITVTAGANGTITPTSGTVNCGSNNAYTIAPNACYHIVDVTLDGVSQGAVSTVNVNNVTANHTITATFAINTYTITVTAGANGTITPTSGTVNCGSNNAYTIAPNACYHIVDVMLDGISQGAVSTLNVNNVTANHTITASFALNTYTITVTAGANGTITPGTGTVNCGSNNIYTIAANACYHIVDVTLDGVSQGAISTLNVNNVTANHTITASFAINTYTITVTAGANGTITPTSGTVNCGSNNAYAITANACYHIVDVTLDAVSQGAVSTVNVNNVTANHTITATFAINTYSITVTPGANGTITPESGTVNCGSNNAYAITANACYHIVDVMLDGVSQGAVPTVNVNNVTANHTITASFALNTYTITVTAGANGTITPGSGTVNCGSNNAYAITANACYHIVDVTLDGVSQGAVSTLNVNNVTANHTITASFALNTYTITVTPGANGTITLGTGTVNCGSNNTYAITANACYHIVDVTLDGVSQGAISTLNVNNVTADHTITASFAINTYTITVTPGANGTITPGTGTVNCGSNNAYTITPNACYRIVDVTLDGISQGAVSTLNVNNVIANHTITASFTLTNYTITVTPGANGTITAGTGTVNCGSNNVYTITANACYHVVDVTLDGISQGAVSTLNVNNVTANHTITASFAINTYTITVTHGSNGAITPGTGTINCGSNNAYTITANACYHIVDVTLDGISQGAVSTLNINNVTADHTITASFAINGPYTITAVAGPNGSISNPGASVVACGSNNTYTITAAPCYIVSDVLVDGLSVGAVTNYTFTNTTANHTISATFVISATYIITVTPGINGTISPGTATVNCGSNNIYTIAANACYHIADVTLDGISQGAVSTLNINSTAANHTIAATFAINTYAITVTAGANGTITPGSGTVSCGSNNTYTIAANACYHIVDVTLDGISQGAVSTLNVNNVTANHTITASFAVNVYTISASSGINGTITPAGISTVDCGTNNTYNITANACYHVNDVVVDGISQGAIITYTFTNTTSNHTIAVTFTINTYTITATSGSNGAVTPAGITTLNCGAGQGYTITANSGYHVVDVLVDGLSVGAVGTYGFSNVTSDHSISATFAADVHTITATSGANGTVTPAGTTAVINGNNQAYTIIPAACYHVVDVLVDGLSVGALSSYTFTNVTTDHTISASFALNTYTITVTPGANGTITPGSGTVNCGSNNTYIIIANACYHIVDVALDGVSQGAISTLNVNNITANHTITATFAINTYAITVTPGVKGTITPGSGTVNCGSNNTYTITANACYHIIDVALDGVSQGAISTLNVNNVTANHTITATFAINTYTITVTAGANGTITPGTGTVNCGSNNAYTIAANTCYHIVDVTLDGISQGAVATLNVNNVTADHTITATFAQNIIPVPLVAAVDNCNGTSTLTASGYTGTLLWSDGGTDNPHVVNLAGSYSVAQTIGTCSSASSATVTATPGSVAAPAITITQPGCASLGAITINTPAATGMTYSINDVNYTNTSGIFTGLTAGSYNVTAKTIDGCVSGITVAAIDPAPGTAGIGVSSVVNNSCHGGSTGTITVTGTGATSPYTYSIVSGPTINNTGNLNGVFTDLTAGNYTIAVTPAAGCNNTVTVAVTEPSGILPDLTMGADYTGNFFAIAGDENTLIYNISEIGGNPAVGDTVRIIRVPGYTFIFDVLATSVTNGTVNYALDNSRWKLDNSNPSFISLILDPGNINVSGTLNCSERVYISIRFKRTTLNASIFTLTARLRKANIEEHLNNNLAPVLFSAE